MRYFLITLSLFGILFIACKGDGSSNTQTLASEDDTSSAALTASSKELEDCFKAKGAKIDDGRDPNLNIETVCTAADLEKLKTFLDCANKACKEASDVIGAATAMGKCPIEGISQDCLRVSKPQ